MKSVCIIGAGASGLAAIKACLEENIIPVCYEFSDGIGGLWNRDTRMKNGQSPRVYPSLIANVSKVASCFSDFPVSDDWPPYVTWQKTLEYLHLYAEHFGLEKYIHFNTEVLRVEKSKDYDNTGSWIVHSQTKMTKDIKHEEYNVVMVCAGKWSKQNKPNIPGLYDNFTGHIIHSGDFDGAEQFKDKSILVVGAGNSGCDMAVECSKISDRVFLSCRNGAWIMSRIGKEGMPVDLTLNRFLFQILDFMPRWLIDILVDKLAVVNFNHEACKLQCKYNPLHLLSNVAVNDEIQLKLYTGAVKTQPDIKEFKGQEVIFKNGQCEKVDVVILATGYIPSFSFLDPDILPENPGDMRLYKWTFPFNTTHPSTLCIIGCVPLGVGPVNPAVELQSRLAVQMFTGKMELPSRLKMKEVWNQERQELLKRSGGQFVFKVPLYKFQEMLAADLKVIPSFWELLFSDPKLALTLYFGPIVPYNYRVAGPNAWDKAREYSIGVKDSIFKGLGY